MQERIGLDSRVKDSENDLNLIPSNKNFPSYYPNSFKSNNSASMKQSIGKNNNNMMMKREKRKSTDMGSINNNNNKGLKII